MKCVCVTECQTRTDKGKIRWFMKGEVASFKKCPTHFRPIEGKKAEKVDFATASEEELLEATYRVADLKAYIEETYERKTGNRGKDKLVEMLMDCRFRALDTDPNTMV